MEILNGFFVIALAVLLFVLAVFWLIFPWMVYSQLNGVLKGLKKLEDSQIPTRHFLSKIERHLEGIEKSMSPSQTSTSSTQALYYFSADGQQQGPVAASDLKNMRKDGFVTDDTPVLREGDSQWKTYRDFLSLTR